MTCSALRISLHWRWSDGRGGQPFDSAVLTDAEHLAAARFRRADDAALWRESRFLLRMALASRLCVPPDALGFARGPRGKPTLCGTAAQTWRFNLSHAGRLAVLAIVDDPVVELGIDLEWTGRPVSQGLIRATTAPDEAAILIRLPPASRNASFLRLWTCKESVLKAAGCGLSVPPAWVVFNLREDTLRRLPPALGSVDDFCLRRLLAPPDHVATLAVRDPQRRRVTIASSEFL